MEAGRGQVNLGHGRSGSSAAGERVPPGPHDRVCDDQLEDGAGRAARPQLRRRMIASFRHGFIFLKSKKTGGSSVEHVLATAQPAGKALRS